MRRGSRTLRTARPTYSDKGLELRAPESWREMTQRQLRYTLFLLWTFQDPWDVRVRMLARFTGLKVWGRSGKGAWLCHWRAGFLGLRRRWVTLMDWQLRSLAERFSYVDRYEDMGCRLEAIHGLRAVDVHLHGVAFIDYLNAEKYYQAFVRSREERFLDKLATLLYRRKGGELARRVRMKPWERLGVFLWYSYVKSELGRKFPHFFKKLPADRQEEYDMMAAINAQVRALTDGDITQEEAIFKSDCWRALTELDAKAREAEELRKAEERARRGGK